MDKMVATVLAAGRSRRMGEPKPILPWKGTTFLGHILGVLEKSGIQRRSVILGPDAEAVLKAVDLKGAERLNNPDVDRGQLSSLWIAVDWAAEDPETDALLVCLVDQPDITIELISQLVDRFHKSDKPIVIPTFEGRRGHPVIFGRTVFQSLKQAPLEMGARAVLREHIDWIDELPVDHPGVLKSANTPDELKEINNE
jgi:molybdenum cofactor cytidylyltransferase